MSCRYWPQVFSLIYSNLFALYLRFVGDDTPYKKIIHKIMTEIEGKAIHRRQLILMLNVSLLIKP